MPLVLKWQDSREFCVNCILEIHGIPPTKAHYPRQHATHASTNSPPFFKLINCVQLLLLPKQYLVMKNKSYMIMCSEVKTNPIEIELIRINFSNSRLFG